jgi:polyhydroxyalkanoate synthesis regulator phasin
LCLLNSGGSGRGNSGGLSNRDIDVEIERRSPIPVTVDLNLLSEDELLQALAQQETGLSLKERVSALEKRVTDLENRQ